VQYAIKHPPERGRIVAYAGPSSYMLWRAPDTPVVINGWLEHFTEAELRANFGILHGSRADPTPYVKRLDAGAVIAYIPKAIERLEAHGFVAKLSSPDGTYLVRDRRP
jgi:ribosomal protein L34